MLNIKRFWGMAVLLLLTSLLISGCFFTKNTGYGERDLLSLQAFNNFELNLAYNYYLYGAGNNYYALLGLDTAYTVPVYKMWKAMPVNDPEMRRISMFLWESPPMYMRMAFALFDPDGKSIGVIYTSTTFSFWLEDDYSLIFNFQTPWLSNLHL